jgi:hypothetical protein
MTERRVLKDIAPRLRVILDEIPFIRAKRWKLQNGLARRRATTQIDLAVDLVVAGKPWRLLLEVKGSGEPRIVRTGIQQLQQYSRRGKRAYGVVAASYISPESRKLCGEAGIGFIDLAGNCRLVFDHVFIERVGVPNPRAERRPLRSIFAPKASRILRVLLENPKQQWKVQDLAHEARVSLGLAAKVKQRLLDLEFAREEEGGLLLVGADGLIRQWGTTHSYLKNDSLDCY